MTREREATQWSRIRNVLDRSADISGEAYEARSARLDRLARWIDATLAETQDEGVRGTLGRALGMSEEAISTTTRDEYVALVVARAEEAWAQGEMSGHFKGMSEGYDAALATEASVVCAQCAMEDDEPLMCDTPGCDGQPRFVTSEKGARDRFAEGLVAHYPLATPVEPEPRKVDTMTESELLRAASRSSDRSGSSAPVECPPQCPDGDGCLDPAACRTHGSCRIDDPFAPETTP